MKRPTSVTKEEFAFALKRHKRLYRRYTEGEERFCALVLEPIGQDTYSAEYYSPRGHEYGTIGHKLTEFREGFYRSIEDAVDASLYETCPVQVVKSVVKRLFRRTG